MLGQHDLRLPFLVAAGVTLVNWVYGLLVLPESLAPENRRAFDWGSLNPFRSLVSLRRWPVVFGLAGSQFLMMLAHNIYPSLWVLYTGHRYGWDSGKVGISLCLVGLTSAIVQGGLAGRILKKIGERRGVVLGLTTMGCGMLGYGLAPEGWMIYVIIVLAAVGGVGGPAEQALISKAVPADQQGAVQGALNSLASVAGVLAPLLWTFIFSASIQPNSDKWLSGLAFLVAGGFSFLAIWPAVRALRKIPE